MEEPIDNSEKSILKGISLFGGVQVIQMIVSVIRGKFVAMILGPEGMGINTLFSSAQSTIYVFGSLGLNLAIVKEISSSQDNPTQLSATAAIALRLILWSSIFGALVCFLLAPVLSRVTFGSYAQTVPFMFLSISLFFSIAAAGKLSILQGLHQVKKLSRASLVGALTGLLIGVPLYYFLGVKGIVPAIICVTAAMYFFYSFTLQRCKLPLQKPVSFSAHKPLVKKILSIGFILVLGNLVTTSVTYIINLFIRTFGDVENVGYFQAANSITMQYLGMVFAAMAVDYLPRLTRKIEDNRYVTELANRQITVLAYIVAPLVTGLILSAPLLIRLLLTKEFENITELIRWMGLGVMFKAINYPLGYITFAKDNKKVYIWTEVVFYNIVNLLLSCCAYYYWGLIGLGVAVIADGIIGIATDCIIDRKLYSFRLNSSTVTSIITTSILTIAAFGASFLPTMPAYTLMSFIFLTSFAVSIRKIKSFLAPKR